MNAITIRKLSESAMAQIERLAALHQRSAEDEAAALIEKGLEALWNVIFSLRKLQP